MTARLILFGGLLACGLHAQLTLYLANGPAEAPVGAAVSVGTVLYGDTRLSEFRLSNAGASSVSLSTFTVAGTGFAVVSPASIPSGIAAGQTFDFTVGFTPTGPGGFSAYLSAPGVSTILLGAGEAAPLISALNNQTRTPLPSGSVIDFGSVENDLSATRDFVIENRLSQKLTVNYIGVTGASFQLTTPPATPLTLAPGASVTLQITLLSTKDTGVEQGGFDVDHWHSPLTASRAAPPLPQPVVSLDLPTLASAQQGKLTVGLASTSRAAGQGKVSMSFSPGGPITTDDASIQFLTTGTRTANFTVSAGDTTGNFSGQSAIEFQTGSTAGEIVFTVELGGFTETKNVVIPPAAIIVDSASAARTSAGLQVQIAALDNTRAATILTFTFFDNSGQPLAIPAIQADETEDFLKFFNTSTLGGVFALTATFPVTGKANQIGAVEVQLTNAAGNSQTKKLQF